MCRNSWVAALAALGSVVLLTPAVQAEVDRVNKKLGDEGRVLVRPSGTEPLIRVLAEAQNEEVARNACATLVSLVQAELG